MNANRVYKIGNQPKTSSKWGFGSIKVIEETKFISRLSLKRLTGNLSRGKSIECCMVHAEREAGLWMNNVWVRKAVCGNKRKQRGSWGKKMKECGPFFKTPRIFSDPFFRLCLLTFWEPATGFFQVVFFFYTICSGKTKIFSGLGEISIQPRASEE